MPAGGTVIRSCCETGRPARPARRKCLWPRKRIVPKIKAIYMQLHCVVHIIPLSLSRLFLSSPSRLIFILFVLLRSPTLRSAEIPWNRAKSRIPSVLMKRVPGPLTLLLRWSGISGEEFLFNRMGNRFLTKFAILNEMGEFLYLSI